MDPAEYGRRAKFLEELKNLSEHEHLEILRLLVDNKVHYSENANGVFFDVASLDSDVFEKMRHFIDFIAQNRADLSARESLINNLSTHLNTEK